MNKIQTLVSRCAIASPPSGLTHRLRFSLQEIRRKTTLMADGEPHVRQHLQTLHRIGNGELAHFVVTRAVAIHLVHDNLRLIIGAFERNHNAIHTLRIAPYHARAQSNAVLGLGHFDPFHVDGLERSDGQQPDVTLLAAQDDEYLLLDNVPQLDDFLALANAYHFYVG